ncbi:GxxExxY protein [Stieleria maiorica]|uniref:GxxExxY protein n=1 Tax=Stieleria maiorica TaxID=2795974 RepID=UPI0011CBB45D|nr:GxxExxY protein [Stieleria maiorica]
MEFDGRSHRVIGCAIEFHRALGPGLLGSASEQCLAHEFTRSGIPFNLQHPQPVRAFGAFPRICGQDAAASNSMVSG